MIVQGTIQEIPLDLIDSGGNIRTGEHDEKIESMMQSMKSVGLLYPIRVHRMGTRYRPTDGFGRVICARRLGWTVIAGIVESDDFSDVDSQLTALIANCQRTSFSDLDTASAVENLMRESGWNASETAAKLGFSNAKVSRLRELLALPEPIRDAIRAGKISSSSGVELSRIDDPIEQAMFAAKVASGELTRDGLAGEVKRRRAPQSDKKGTAAPRITAALGNGRSVTLVGSGLTSLDALISWLEELLAKARKCRPKGLELGTFVRILRDEAKTL